MWFLLALAVVVAFGLLVVWSVGWFFGLALATKLFASALIVATGVTVALVRVLLLRHRGTRLEREIFDQGARAIEQAKPDRRRELTELQEEMSRSFALLGRATGGAAGMPLYVIVGPPGAGKTTAIKESGLPFPLERGARATRGTGGTRNCHWWFTSEAALLDTAGRYSGDDDQEEWFAFLDLLKRHRPRKPVHGLVVALSVGDLVSASREQITAAAAQLRARVDEVTTRLKMLVPVYVVFTKTDLIPGFAEFWDDLRPSDREQAWGMTFDVGPRRAGEPKEAFEREFGLLMQTLYGRAVRRLHGERRVAVRRALWAFPAEFGALKSNLAEFVERLFAPNGFQETPLLRGAYFTSGTQNQRASARVLASMGSAFGVSLSNALPAAPEPKSYFLHAVFRRVMFPDRDLAGYTAAEARRRLLFRLGAAAFTTLVSASLLLPGVLTWSKNRQLVAAVAEIDGAVQAVNWAEPKELDRGVASLDAARARLAELASWKENGVPTPLRWGMYVGDGLHTSLRGVYGAALSQLVVRPAKRELENRLRALDTGPVRTSEHFNRDFDTLKLYLMLGDPKHVDPEWAAPRLLRVWSDLPHARAPDEEALLMAHAKYVLELLQRGELPAWRPDEGLVSRSRSILAQVPQMDRLYESLVRDANATLPPIRREMVFYGASAKFVQSKKGVRVAGAYTRAGWQRVRKLLGERRDELAAEEWVLADSDGADGQATVEKLRSLYFDRYQDAWKDFLGDLFVQDPGNGEVAIEELNALAEPEWPYLRLVRLVSDNVTLDVSPDEKQGLVEKAIDSAKSLLDGGAPAPKRATSPVERAFRPMLAFALPPQGAPPDNPPATALSQYEALLAKLVGALTDLRDAESGTDPRKVSDVFQDAVRGASALLSEQDAFTRPLLSPLLMQPITLAWRDVVHDTGAAVGADWESSVWTRWHDKLEGRYPFAASPTDATLDDVVNFFAPGDGTLWSFFDEALKPTLDRSGSTFTPSRRFRSSVEYAPDFLDVCLKRGRQISDVLFAPKSDHAAVTFDVNLHSVSPTVGEVTFEVDGVSHTYRNEPEEWLTITWPGKSPHGARLRVRGAGGMNEELKRPGDFGLFRLLDAAEVKPGRAGGRPEGAPTLVATWGLRAATDGAFVSIDVRPSRNENPLTPGYFRSYQCPRAITNR
ncbi:MAG TPA: type VI secretion system membrane subunit TssM [Polyangiaceae bacterium]|jgi:type VI secretion system protein ImpL